MAHVELSRRSVAFAADSNAGSWVAEARHSAGVGGTTPGFPSAVSDVYGEGDSASGFRAG